MPKSIEYTYSPLGAPGQLYRIRGIYAAAGDEVWFSVYCFLDSAVVQVCAGTFEMLGVLEDDEATRDAVVAEILRQFDPLKGKSAMQP